MTKWGWTGSRQPSDGELRYIEVIKIAIDVVMTIKDGDSVATGGCSGVDEVVLETALYLRSLGMRVSIETFPADGERTWQMTRAPLDLITQSDVVHWREKGWGYLERDRALVNWADHMHAIPLYGFDRTQHGFINVTRGSGTAYTARRAEDDGKLVAIIPLRSKTPAWYANGFAPVSWDHSSFVALKPQ